MISRCAVIFWSLLLTAGCSAEDDGIIPERQDITESVYASLEIQPDSLYLAFAVVSGIIEKVLIEEGDQVQAGDPLLLIKNEAPELNLANAELALKRAEADLKSNNNALIDLENQIKTAALQQKDDSLNYYRQKRLWEQNIGSKTELERRQLALDLSTNRLSNLRSSYNKLERDLKIQYEQAKINLQVARVNTGDYTVRSKIDGKVYSIEKQVGEKVSMQEYVATIGSASNFVIELLIDERDIAKVKMDQHILITLEAYGKEVFHASVIKIYPQKNNRNQSFLVEARFEDRSPDELYAGLSGEANVIINQRSNALTIPVEYLASDSRVLTKDGLVEVEIGLRGLDRVEILEGIDENTKLYLPE